MSESEIVARIIGTEVSLSDVADAFTSRHPTIPEYSWSAAVLVKGDIIVVSGTIHLNGSEIGHFSRRLFYEKGVGRAYHEIMEIDRPHRDNDIGKHHYGRALRFYRRVGIRFVSMEAEGEGPVIWPTFGFDFSRDQHRAMMMKILKDWEIRPLPGAGSVLAPQVVDINIDENPELGQQAIYELVNRAAEPLPMILDLEDETQAAYLHNRGIL